MSLISQMNIAKSRPIHQGKWTREEEEYVECLTEEFKLGLLPLAEGTSLRIFLSKMLNCDPMRISKKFLGTNYNGKQLYVRKPNIISMDVALQRRAKLQELENKFLKRVQRSRSCDHSSKSISSSPLTSSANISTVSLSASCGKGSVENFLSEQSLVNGVQGHNSNHRANSRAAACGRALLQGSSIMVSKSSAGTRRQTSAASSLATASSMEILAELQRRNAEKVNNEALMRQASCSSLDLDTSAEIERPTSRENLMTPASRGISSSSILLEPALFERALNSLSSSRNNHSVVSLSSGFDRKESMASLSDFRTKGSFGSFGSLADPTHDVADGGKNWSFGHSNMPTFSANNLSKTTTTSCEQQDGVAALHANRWNNAGDGFSGISNTNIRNLLISTMNKTASMAHIGSKKCNPTNKASDPSPIHGDANFSDEKRSNSSDNGFCKLMNLSASSQNMAALMGMSKQDSINFGQGRPKQLTMQEQIRQVMSARETEVGQSFAVNNLPSVNSFSIDNLSMDRMSQLQDVRQQSTNNINTVDQQSVKRSLFSQDESSFSDGRSLKKRKRCTTSFPAIM